MSDGNWIDKPPEMPDQRKRKFMNQPVNQAISRYIDTMTNSEFEQSDLKASSLVSSGGLIEFAKDDVYLCRDHADEKENEVKSDGY